MTLIRLNAEAQGIAHAEKSIRRQAFSFENTRRAKNGPCRIKKAGHRQTMCYNIAAKRGDACMIFGG